MQPAPSLSSKKYRFCEAFSDQVWVCEEKQFVFRPHPHSRQPCPSFQQILTEKYPCLSQLCHH